jgi:Flp pilus assembly protein TadD
VFLDQQGQPKYSVAGYKLPPRFIAECVKASDTIGIAVPGEVRAACAGESATGTVLSGAPAATATSTTPGNGQSSFVGTFARNPAARNEQRLWPTRATPASAALPAAGSVVVPETGSAAAQAPASAPAPVAYSPLREACFDINNGKCEPAIAILNRLVVSNPCDARAHYLLAVAYVMTHRYSPAAQQYTTVIKLSPNSQLGSRAREGLAKLGY